MQTAKTKSGKTVFLPTLAEIQEASELQQGFCIACGATRDCCEPDARRYECEECGESKVYGAEELALMGYIAREQTT